MKGCIVGVGVVLSFGVGVFEGHGVGEVLHHPLAGCAIRQNGLCVRQYGAGLQVGVGNFVNTGVGVVRVLVIFFLGVHTTFVLHIVSKVPGIQTFVFVHTALFSEELVETPRTFACSLALIEITAIATNIVIPIEIIEKVQEDVFQDCFLICCLSCFLRADFRFMYIHNYAGFSNAMSRVTLLKGLRQRRKVQK